MSSASFLTLMQGCKQETGETPRALVPSPPPLMFPLLFGLCTLVPTAFLSSQQWYNTFFYVDKVVYFLIVFSHHFHNIT